MDGAAGTAGTAAAVPLLREVRQNTVEWFGTSVGLNYSTVFE